MSLLPEGFVIDWEGGACPYQAEGSFGGERFYFRYRSDNASLSVGPPSETDSSMPVHPPRLYAVIFGVFDEPLRGFLERKEAHELMARLVDLLKPPSEWDHGTHRDRLVAFLNLLSAVSDKEDDECL